jgi:hypothetical protein
MSETPLVPPPSNAGESGAPGEEGLPASDLLGTGPQDAVAPGADPDEPAPDGDAALAAPDGDPGGSASELSSTSDAAGVGGSDVGSAASSDPLPDPSGTQGS